MKLSKEDKKQFALCSHSRTHNRHFRERERDGEIAQTHHQLLNSSKFLNLYMYKAKKSH